MNEILNIILKDTYSLSDLKHRLNILKTYIVQNLFGVDQSTQKQPAETDLAWLKSLSPAFFQNFNKDNTYQLMSELDKTINQLKTLTIYVAFEPDSYSLILMGKYVRKTFSQPEKTTSSTNFPILLDIKYDPSQIAGCALVWNGIYKDFSLRSGILDKRQLILDSFKKYLR